MNQLSSITRSLIDYSLARPTRIHKLNTSGKNELWIKREDELSSGISGSKLRKYASLLPYLRKQNIQTVGMIGGPNSNNLVGLAQLLKENSIKPTAFIREAADTQLRGNALLLDMLLERDELQFIPRDQWDSAESIAKTQLGSSSETSNKSKVLLEGCFGIEGLPGAMSLAEDIVRNESESNIFFERIYIDCGTGLSAIGLILGFENLEIPQNKPREVVVTLIAEEEDTFLKKLREMRSQFPTDSKTVSSSEIQIRFLKPTLSPKFGSINKELFKQCRSIAKSTGLIMDPTYSVKHYRTALFDHNNCNKKSTALFIFNGSALGVLGFQEKLAVSSLDG